MGAEFRCEISRHFLFQRRHSFQRPLTLSPNLLTEHQLSAAVRFVQQFQRQRAVGSARVSAVAWLRPHVKFDAVPRQHVSTYCALRCGGACAAVLFFSSLRS